VVLDMAPFALGTDTGGSIRLPASFCGTVGFKPTYGLVSRSGVVAMGSSLDVIGPLTRTVADTALVLDVIAGKDKLDSTTIERQQSSYSELSGNLNGKKIGIIKEHMGEDVDPSVKAKINDTLQKIKEAGAEVKEVSLPSLPLALAAYYIICPAEVSSNLSRYDGQRYGYSYADALSINESYSISRDKGFNKENKRRIMIGTYVLSSGYYDAYYKKAQTVRTKLINEFNKIFQSVDFLAGPVTPSTAFKIGEHSDFLRIYMTDIMTVAANLVGIPAVSIPAGQSDGLPVGLHIMAAQNKDKDLLEIAKLTEEIINE
jgi:aspartyl-tRNA(Asn)/glutamyl-tRNA(Gln) amidotransferase subunit A